MGENISFHACNTKNENVFYAVLPLLTEEGIICRKYGIALLVPFMVWKIGSHPWLHA